MPNNITNAVACLPKSGKPKSLVLSHSAGGIRLGNGNRLQSRLEGPVVKKVTKYFVAKNATNFEKLID